MLGVVSLTIVIFALFIVKAFVRRTWQKKFTAAVLLLIGSLVVLARSLIAIGEDTTCTQPIIRATLIIQSIAQNGAYWIFSKSLWDDSLRLQDLMGENSLFLSKGSRIAVSIVFWTLLSFSLLCNYVYQES
jgi:hypothetical protein